jgi:WD40 repeat protein
MIHIPLAQSRRLVSPLIALVSLVVSATDASVAPPDDLPAAAAKPPDAAKPVPRTDREGFPLPDEALARVGSAKLRHAAGLEHLEYSPDGTLLLSAGQGSVRIWDARTGLLFRDVAVKQDGMSAGGVFTADGKAVVVRDGQRCRWIDVLTGLDVRSCKIKVPIGHGTVCMAPHGDAIAVTDGIRGKDLIVYELPSGRERARISAAGPWMFPSMAFSADGHRLAVCDLTGRLAVAINSRIRVFDTTTGGSLVEFDSQEMRFSMVFSPDDKLLAVGGMAHVDIRSVADGKVVNQVHTDRALGETAIAFGAKGASVLVARGSYLVQTELATVRQLHRFYVGGSSACLAMTADRQGVAIGTDEGSISQWSLVNGERQAPSADPILVSGTMRFASDRALELWAAGLLTVEWPTGRELRRVRLPLKDVAVAADGSLVAAVNAHLSVTVAPDGTRTAPLLDDLGVSVWDGRTGKKVVKLSRCLGELAAFSPDGRKVYTSDTGDVEAWDAKTGKYLEQIHSRDDAKLSFTQHLAVSPDGCRLAAAAQVFNKAAICPESEITVWDVANGNKPRKPLRTPLQVAAIAFSPDGDFLAAVGGMIPGLVQNERSLELWDVRTGEPKSIHSGREDRCASVAFSPDGRVLATGDGAGGVVLWELTSRRERHRFVGARSAIAKLAFSGDGKLLASASPDAPVFVWDIEGCYGKPVSTEPLSADSAAKLWAALEDADASLAFAAMRELFTRPGPAVALLRERLRPAAGVDEKAVRGWLRDLDSDTFAVREKAAADLESAVDVAEPILRAALKEKQSAETKRRLESILESAAAGAAGGRRQVRAVEVAEHLATAEARALLETWSGGAEGALLTREARSAIGRLKARS